MKTFAILVSLLAVALAAPNQVFDPRIIGGVDALRGEFPFIVSVQTSIIGIQSHTCGGSILTNMWVLSAAQCWFSIPVLGSMSVIAGRTNFLDAETSQQPNIDRIRSQVHPDWQNDGNGPDDLVLVSLVSYHGASFSSRLAFL